MTRVLYWNINNFSKNKIDAAGAGAAASGDRLNYILDEVFQRNPPDIFVIVELYARIIEVGFWGTLVSANVRSAVLTLVDEIRNRTGNNDWSVVPPICTGEIGFREGVGVFFNSAILRFDGPYVWGPDYRISGGKWTSPINRACPVAATVRPAASDVTWPNGPQDYPAAWAGELPVGNTQIPLPAGVPGAPGVVPEARAAAQWEFTDIAGTVLTFPTGFNRAPYLVEFTENPGAAGARTIKLLAIHTSPLSPAGGVTPIADIDGLAPAGGNDVTVVLGDFNVDSLSSIGTYAGLDGAGFTMQIDPRNPAGAGGAVVAASRPYCQTHLLPNTTATPYNDVGVTADPTHNDGPAYGYMGSMGGFLFQTPVYAGAIDNVFTQHAGAPPASHMTVVNTIVGSPYAPPAGIPPALAGALAYPTVAPAPIPPGGVDDDGSAASAAAVTHFRAWPNFGVIRSTSDHLPLIVDV